MSVQPGRTGYQFQHTTVWIEGPGVSARIYAEGVFNSTDAFEIAGAGWGPAAGTIKLRVAAQRREAAWHGVGRLSTDSRQFQFATVMTLAVAGDNVCLSGLGTLRKTGEVLQLSIKACRDGMD
jgi:hypothetical protein